MAAGAVQLLAGGTVLLVVALSLGELDPTRWLDVSRTSAGAAVFLLVFDSLAGFMLYTRLLESAPAPLVSTYAYVTPLVGAVIGATVLDEPLWAGAFAGGALVLGAVALAERAILHVRIGLVAAFGFVVAASLFAGDLSMRQYAGNSLFPMAAPTGGTLLIASWLVLAVSAAWPKPDRT